MTEPEISQDRNLVVVMPSRTASRETVDRVQNALEQVGLGVLVTGQIIRSNGILGYIILIEQAPDFVTVSDIISLPKRAIQIAQSGYPLALVTVSEREEMIEPVVRAVRLAYMEGQGPLMVEVHRPGHMSELNGVGIGIKKEFEQNLRREEATPPSTGPGSIFTATPSGFETQPRPIPESERADPTQKALHARLIRRAEQLSASVARISNTHPALSAEFADYAEFLSGDIEQTDIASLWSVGAGLYEFVHALAAPSRGTMAEPLEPDVLAMLRALMRDHTAFVLGFAEGRELAVRAQQVELLRTPPEQLAINVSAILQSMLATSGLLGQRAMHLAHSLLSALNEMGYRAAPLISSGYETGRNALIAIGSAVAGLYAAAHAIDLVELIAGSPNPNTLHAAIIFLSENGNLVAAFAACDPQLAEWLAWVIANLAKLPGQRDAP